eukprot:3487074-Pleurochrysis_carterae.AAC.1
MGHRGGPSGGLIMPRVCSYCDYYGHTRQFCSRLKEDRVNLANKDTDDILAQHMRWLERHEALKQDRDPEWTAYVQWCDDRYTAARDANVPFCSVGFPACEKCAECGKSCEFYTVYDVLHPPPVWRERWGANPDVSRAAAAESSASSH